MTDFGPRRMSLCLPLPLPPSLMDPEAHENDEKGALRPPPPPPITPLPTQANGWIERPTFVRAIYGTKAQTSLSDFMECLALLEIQILSPSKTHTGA